MTDQPETPKILDQISKGTNASVTRKQQNARRRFIIVLVLLVPLFGAIGLLGFRQFELQAMLTELQSTEDRTDELSFALQLQQEDINAAPVATRRERKAPEVYKPPPPGVGGLAKSERPAKKEERRETRGGRDAGKPGEKASASNVGDAKKQDGAGSSRGKAPSASRTWAVPGSRRRAGARRRGWVSPGASVACGQPGGARRPCQS